MKSLFAVLIILSLFVVIITGCAEKAPAGPATTTAIPKEATPAPPQQQYGGTLKILTNTIPSQIGYPAEITTGTPMYGSSCPPIFDYLFYKTLDLRPTPGLVQTWEIAADKKSMVWHLKQGVKFHDGTDFNAEAVKYNLQAMAATPGGKGSFANVTSYDIIDPYTIRVNLSQFSAILMSGTLASYMGFMASPTAMKIPVTSETAGLHMVGTGPFKFASFQRDVALRFEKWSGYYEKGKPYLDAIEIRKFADYTTKLMAFKAGDGQYVSDIASKDFAALKAAGFLINQFDYCSVLGLVPDSANPDSPWSNLKVREAAQYAINTQSIANNVFGEGTLGATQAAAPKDPFYVSGLDRPYNPAKAKELLTQAGYPNGFKTTFYMDMTSQNAGDYTVVIQNYLKAVGIDVEIQLCDMPKLTALRTGGWKNGLVNGASGFPGLSYFQAAFAEFSRNNTNKSMARPAGLQVQIDTAIAEADDNKRLEMYKGLIKTLFDDCTYIPVYAQYLTGAFAPEVHDAAYGKSTKGYWESQNTWLSTKK